MTRVGIVGAGITGLSLIHYLAERGVEAVAFEATGQPGGVIRSDVVEGRVLEWGPQRMRFTDPVRELVGAVELSGEVIRAPGDLPLYVYANGGLGEVPLSVGTFLTTDLLSARGKLRALAEPLTAPGRPGETAAELFTRKFGEETYRNVVGPLFGGIYASDPAEMPARHALAGLLRLESEAGSLLRAALGRIRGDRPPAVSFEDGMGQLPEALADRHAGRISFGTPVTSVAEVGGADGEGGENSHGDGNGGDDGGGGPYRLETPEGSQRVEEVVLTTPADVTAEVVADLAPDAADALAELNYNPLAMVYLYSDVDARGLGYQVRRDEDLHTLGVSWNASAFDRDGVYTVFLGGMHEPELIKRADDALGKIAREEFAAVMGAAAGVLAVNRWERGFPAYDRSFDALDRVSLPAGVHLATNYTGRVGVPSRIREARRLAGVITG
jgi:oxygen-dependent protoporphyrinogen oxidase